MWLSSSKENEYLTIDPIEMKNFTLSMILISGLFLTQACAQKSEKRDKKNETTLTVTIDNEDVDIEVAMEKLGESLEDAFENVDKGVNISINIDDQKFEASMEKFGEAMERLGESIEKMVSNMSIEVRNIDAREIKEGDGKINGTEIKDLIREIEDEYDQEVETVDRMYMKFSDDNIHIEMDVTLENGKEIRNIKRKIKNK